MNKRGHQTAFEAASGSSGNPDRMSQIALIFSGELETEVSNHCCAFTDACACITCQQDLQSDNLLAGQVSDNLRG